jgi:hypothetical protein
MSDKKVFSINPDLFSFSNTTKKRKKKDTTDSERIKMKQNTVVKNKDTLRKKSILKMIRNHQSERNKENFTSYEKQKSAIPTSSNNDFENAKTFFDNMVIETKKEPSKNYTIKNYTNLNPSNVNIDLNGINDIASSIKYSANNSVVDLKPRENIPVPKYGCLKNGNLPTYRDYMNKTRKSIDNDVDDKLNIHIQTNNDIYGGSTSLTQKANIIQQSNEKLKNLKKKRRHYRKKTIKRTFKLGRSRIKPAVTVLITNKTVRNKISESKQKLSQTPIPEMRTYLIKNGFIKIGSITPNDVLRKMYESALLICGEVKNHNSDTLMYNFLNSKEEL